MKHSTPPDMNAAAYRTALRRVLDESSPLVARRLEAIREAATPQTEAVIIEVFIDQSGEGPFSVWARFEGTDAFEVNQRLADERELFSVRWNEERWDPPVPERPMPWSWDELEDVLIDAVADWIDPLIPIDSTGLRWELTSPEGTQDHLPLGALR